MMNDEATVCRKAWSDYISGKITHEELQEICRQFEQQPELAFKGDDK